MAFAPGLNFPNAQGYPAPIVLEEVFRRWQPDPARFAFRDLLPEKAYQTEYIAYDVLHSPTGRLSDGDMDAMPVNMAAGRAVDTVTLKPVYKDLFKILRPSDAIRQRKFGTLSEISPSEKVSLLMEEIALAIEVEQELMRVGALTGSLQPSIWGVNDVAYSYPVQTFDVTNTGTGGSGFHWSNLASSNPVADIMNAMLLLRGKAFSPTLWINLTNAQYLAQNAQIINLAKQSVYADQLGPGMSPGSEMVSDVAVCSLLKQFTGIAGIRVYDDGYKDSSEVFHTFLPDATGLLIGTPPLKQPLGWVGVAPTIHNGGFLNPSGGRFLRSLDTTPFKFNGGYEMYGGFNGIPALPFPEAIVKMAL